MKNLLLSSAFLLTLSGCMSLPEKAYVENQPKTQPMRNLTNMDRALACFDKQLSDYHIKSPIYIATTGIPNRAGSKVDVGSGEDMLKTSVGQLATSNLFRFVDLSSLAMGQYGTNGSEQGFRPTDAASITAWIQFLNSIQIDSGAIHLPGYLISGSISQMDGNTLSDQSGGSIGVNKIGNVGVSEDQMVSIVTVDMQVMDAIGREIINGLTTKNSLAIKKGGIGMDLSGTVKTVGGSFNVSYDRSEGLHQGIRDLIQLSAIELLGRLAKVPYQRCLGMEANQPNALIADVDNYDDMDEEQRIRFVQRRLMEIKDVNGFIQTPFYQGPVSGELNSATREAISRFQSREGLIANGQINLDLYRSLKNPLSAKTKVLAAINPPSLNFTLEDGRQLGEQVRLSRNSKLVIGLQANQDGYANCFLKNQQNQIYRVFPTLEQSDEHIKAGSTLFVPESRVTQIVFNSPSQEEFACIISKTQLKAGSRLGLTQLGASPLPNVDSLQQVFEQYQQLEGDNPITLKMLRFEVE